MKRTPQQAQAADAFGKLMGAVAQHADAGSICGKESWNEPLPRAVLMVRLGGVVYDVHVAPTDFDPALEG